MIAYKLVRELNDGSFSPLFINKTQRIPIGIWLDAEDHPTKSYAHRKGWHCTANPSAPHLTKKNRTWVKVEVKDYEKYKRSEHQGGEWILAQKMMVIEKIN